MANQFFDRRLGYLVQTPGLDTPLETLEFKAGDGEEIVLQFGRSPDSATPISVVSSPTWTPENLPSGSTIAIGIKAEGDYYDGDLLAGTSSFTHDTGEMTYTFDLDLNTTAINTALSRADADDTNDVAAIENALYEVTYTPGAGGTDKSSVRDITTTIKHDVLSGAEGTPTNAGDPDDYSLITNTIQFFPAISSQTGGTAADLDSITTVARSAGEGVAFFDDDSSGDLRVYELVAGTDAESAPDVIRPDDYASSTNEKVWKLRLDISGGGGGISNVVDDTTPQLGGPLDTNSKPIKESKGADVASANALSLGTDGNFFDITGTTTIASIDTIAVGTEVTLQFDDALTLNHSTDLYLPTQNNITTAAGDVAKFREYDTGDWVCVSYLRADGTAVASSGGISNLVEDTTPQLGGPLDANSKLIKEAKGSDIASATTLTLGTDGNFFDITGTTTISAIATVGVGAVVTLQFDGALTLNHSTTNLKLPGEANITTTAGDRAIFREHAAGKWTCIAYTKLDGTAVINDLPTGGSTGEVLTKSSGTDYDADWATAATAANITEDVNDTAHGHSVGDILEYTQGSDTWAATMTRSNKLRGIVTVVTDVDNFTVLLDGVMTGLTSLTKGQLYFCSEDATSVRTTTRTWWGLGKALSSTELLIRPWVNGIGKTLLFREEQTSGTEGGTFTAGAKRTRTLNVSGGDDDILNASLASNAFTLDPGRWRVRWSAPAYRVGRHQSFLDDGSTVAEGEGTVQFNHTGTSGLVVSRSEGCCTVNLSSSDAFTIEHECETTFNTSGLGIAASIELEVYTIVEATFLGF